MKYYLHVTHDKACYSHSKGGPAFTSPTEEYKRRVCVVSQLFLFTMTTHYLHQVVYIL